MINVQSKRDEVLAAAKKKFGFVPNLIKEMVKSPAAAQVYMKGQEVMTEAFLTNQEQQVIQLAISTINNCHYCTKAHSALCKLAGTPQEEIEAIQSGSLPQDERLKALVSATRLIHEKKGWLSEEDLQSLDSLGIDRVQIYEIIALIGLKTLSNYINHIAHTELDPQMKD